MISRPLIKYFGSKWRLARYYPAPKHDLIIESCAGGAAYALHHSEHKVLLVDLDPDVVAIWSWLIQAKSSEILKLPVHIAPGTDLRKLGLPPPAAMLIGRWQRVGRNDCMTVSKWNNANTGFWSEQTRAAIAKNVNYIRHWKVMCAGYDEIINTNAVWFVDPPYQHVKGYKFEKINYHHLAEWCTTRHGQVIVCEQRGADWLPFRSFRDNTSGRTSLGGTRKKSSEVIWTNC